MVELKENYFFFYVIQEFKGSSVEVIGLETPSCRRKSWSLVNEVVQVSILSQI